MKCENCGNDEGKTSLFGEWSEETGEFIFANLCETCNSELKSQRDKEDLENCKACEPFFRDIFGHTDCTNKNKLRRE